MLTEAIKTRVSSGMSHYQGESDGRGVDSKFFIMDEDWGIKFPYDDNGSKKSFAEIRDDMYERQKAAAALGLAPNVGEKVDLPEIGHYGYITERVDVQAFRAKTYDQCGIESYAVEKEMDEKLGYCYCDLHSGNYGYRKDGTLVRLDFGMCGISRIHYVRI